MERKFMSCQKRDLDYKGFIIHRNPESLVCLTDMWKAQGSVKSKEIDKWLLQERICDLLLQLVVEAKPELKSIVEKARKDKPVANSGSKEYRAWASQLRKLAKQVGLIQTKGGKDGGTYVAYKLAIAYAEDLSAEFHSWALTALKERIEEEADPELGINRSRQRAIRHWERQGKSREYIGARLDSIPREDDYESALSQHGVRHPKEFASCKFKVYLPIIGDTNKFRIARNLKKGQNCKDGMSLEELATTDFAKVLSAKRINTSNAEGAKACENISYAAAQQVAQLLNQ
jgi:hypothetical protein